MQGMWDGQYASALVVTPSDTTLINCRAIYVGTSTANAQAVAIASSISATAVTFVNVVQGTTIPVELNGGRIMSTNTTATNIVALA